MPERVPHSELSGTRAPGPDPAEARRLLREASLELARLRRIRGASHRTWRRIARTRARLAFAAALLGAALAEPALAGTPIFQRRPLTDVGSSASPTFADIDGDGDLDAFIGERWGYTVFHENTGSATTPAFAAAATSPFGLSRVASSYFGGWSSPAFADLDGDGDLDAFVGEQSGDTFFFENTGTADAPAFSGPSTNPFGLANSSAVPGQFAYAKPAFADIDADADLDAFVGREDGHVIFFANTGSAGAPAFAAASTSPFGLFGGNGSMDFVDIDGDGDLDAFSGRSGGGTIFFENTGTASVPAFAASFSGVFGLPVGGGYVHPGFTRIHPAFADVDGDGDFDGFTGLNQGTTTWFENTGTASAPAFVETAPVLGIGEPAPANAGPAPATPAVADLDGDGDLDAFVGEYNGRTVHFPNTGTASAPAFGDASIDPFGLVGVGYDSSPAFADIDGDADLDLFTGEFYGRTIVFENTGTALAPAFGAPPTNPFGLADVGTRSTPALVDIDGDGDLDAFVGNLAGNTFFFENTGNAVSAAFAAPSSNPFGLVDVGELAHPEFADVDGDGDPDAFVGNRAGNTLFFENTGSAFSPAFAAPSTSRFGLVEVGDEAAPHLADIDADGDLDVLVGTSVGKIVFFQNFELGPGTCVDGLDNDGDGLTDADDPGCSDASDPDEKSDLQCDNGLDDDGDGKLDWRGNGTGDPDCISPSDESEFFEPGPGICTDGLDNDGDGLTDADDPGCSDPSDPDERSDLACDNGLDDDGDGTIDWRGDGSGDPGCSSPSDVSELASSPAGCGIGPELLLLAPVLAAARRRRAR